VTQSLLTEIIERKEKKTISKSNKDFNLVPKNLQIIKSRLLSLRILKASNSFDAFKIN